MKFSVMFARFPYGGYAGTQAEHPDTVNWLIQTYHKAATDPRVSNIHMAKVADTPVTMARNQIIEQAKEKKADVVVMIDSDMSPDLPGEKPFWDTTVDYWLARGQQPMVVGAPYCGPIPGGKVHVFRMRNHANPEHAPEGNFVIETYPREEAAERAGFERVAAIGTGLIFIDMRVFDRMEPPHFYYEWNNKTESAKHSTEDVTFTRDCGLIARVPVFVNWDSWAGHWKNVRVDKPRPITIDRVSENLFRAVERGMKSTDRLIVVEDNLNLPAQIPAG